MKMLMSKRKVVPNQPNWIANTAICGCSRRYRAAIAIAFPSCRSGSLGQQLLSQLATHRLASFAESQ
jgi:hypothetical protein